MATAIIIVSYKTPEDVAECLRALDERQGGVVFDVFIVENGGLAAYEALLAATSAVTVEADAALDGVGRPLRHSRLKFQRLPATGAHVAIAEGKDNLGYSGGVNSWLERLVGNARWDGFWILNPDTEPEPMALAALVSACAQSGRGMAGSTIIDYRDRDRIDSRGLFWRRWRMAALSVDHGRRLSTPIPEPRQDIDAPTGTSVFVTRDCLQEIGFMNEDYFLYFEDLEWGMRAKAAGLLCHADGSLVPHKYGTALGSARRRADRSQLSVYLDARNTLLFTRNNDARLLPWAMVCSLLKILEFCAVGSITNASAAFSGVVAGVKGESGKPEWYR